MKTDRKPIPLTIEGLIPEHPVRGPVLTTFPSLGVMSELVDSFSQAVDDPVLSPPPNDLETLTLGAMHSPEGCCLPFKLILGNLMKSLSLGANKIGMITEQGPCRLGLYSLGMRLVFADLGIEAEWFDFNNTNVRKGYVKRFQEVYFRNRGKRISLWGMCKGFLIGVSRLAAVESLQTLRNDLLPFELEVGSISEGFDRGAKVIRQGRTPWEIWGRLRQARKQLLQVPMDRTRQTVRVVVTGEVACVIDPFANSHIETRLARLGAQPVRVLWQVDYLLHTMRLNYFQKRGRRVAARAAKAYLPEHIGGDCNANIGHAVLAHRRGDDGMIHLKPFGCMLEFVAENILSIVQKKTGFPIMSLTLDDLDGNERLNARLEAFVDNLFQRKYGRPGGRSSS
jgi:predicted nucleotide-binding protein (sugar kinase/HSP70/actin superfamily)